VEARLSESGSGTSTTSVLGEVEEHCRITALGDDPSGGGIGLEPMLFKILLPQHALHSILSI
jgi:hypothetical protein